MLFRSDFKVAATAKSCGKVIVSHAAVKSFDRRGVSCKNARTVQFSGGDEKCPVTQTTALPLANCSTHELRFYAPKETKHVTATHQFCHGRSMIGLYYVS